MWSFPGRSDHRNHFPFTRGSPWSPLAGNEANTICSRPSFPFSSVLLVPLLPDPSKFLLTIGYKPLPVTATMLITLVNQQVRLSLGRDFCLQLQGSSARLPRHLGELSSLCPPHGRLHPSHPKSEGKVRAFLSLSL